jgi:hypothetical protein
MFELCAQGNGCFQILKNLNGDGKSLTKAWVNLTLRNRAVLGEFKSAKVAQPIHDYYPRIIDADLWIAARAAVDSRNHIDIKRCVAGRSDSNNLFTLKAFDVTNGVRHSMQKQAIDFITNTRCGKGESHRVRYDTFERAFRVFIRSEKLWKNVISSGAPPELESAQKELDDLTNDVATIRSKIAARESELADAEAGAGRILGRMKAQVRP